jgi:sarcosine oxidase
MEEARVAVVGLGAMGSAACYHLARRGVDVVGFDQFDVPNARGSSHGESRIIRACYYEHPDYVPLLTRAFELWHELGRAALRPVIDITGGLFIGEPASPLVAGSRRAAEEHHIAHDVLNRDALRARFPQFELDATMEALYEPGAGLVRPEAAVAAHATLAQRCGARLHANEPVLEWHAVDNGLMVETAERTVRVRALVVCAGAWTPRIAPALAGRLEVTRQLMAWVAPDDHEPFAAGTFPVWAMQHDDGDFHYGFPVIDAARGLKLGRHVRGAPDDPDRLNRTPVPADEQEVRPFLQRYLPRANGIVREMSVCMYTNTPDSHFIVDRHPDHPQVHIACGFSGHGFKFAPVIGEALADLSLTGRTNLPIGFLSATRFR